MVPSFTQASLCNTPLFNISRDNCAINHKDKHERVLQYDRYKPLSASLDLQAVSPGTLFGTRLGLRARIAVSSKIQKNPRAHNKIVTPPHPQNPNPPPQHNEGFYGHGRFLLQKEPKNPSRP